MARAPRRQGRLTLLACLALTQGALTGWTREFRVNQLPNGNLIRCAACHVSPNGGGPRNPFGLAVFAITGTSAIPFWSNGLATGDADGDGFANGVELGDPEGDGTVIAGWQPTNPGLASSRPNAAPVVAVTAPADGTTLTAPAVATLVAEASDTDGSVVRVEFFDAGAPLGTDTTSPYSLEVDWSVGTHVLTARAVDNRGAATTSAPVTFTVVAPGPVTLARPALDAGTVRLSWSGGGGPFAIETKSDLGAPWTPSELVVTTREAAIPASAGAGFVRVADTAVIGPLALTAALSGANERPEPVNTPATGSGTLTLEDNTLTFQITYTGLLSAATAAHVHGPATVSETAPPMIDLAPFNGGAFGTSGTLAGSVILTAEQKAAILAGKSYLNIHTADFGGGEIRGQVVR